MMYLHRVNLLPTLDQIFVLSKKSPTKHFSFLWQCVERANEIWRVTNGIGQNSFILSILVPLFQKVGDTLAVKDATLQNNILCHGLLLDFIANIGTIKVEVGGLILSDTNDYAQVDTDHHTICLNLLWMGSVSGCEGEDELKYHQAICVTKMFHQLAKMLTTQIMRWMCEKQGQKNSSSTDLQTPKEIGTKWSTMVEPVTVKVCVPDAPPRTEVGPSTTIPALKRKSFQMGDMGLGLEEILLGGLRVDIRPEDRAQWRTQSLLFTAVDCSIYEMHPEPSLDWANHILNSPLPRKIENFTAWYAPPLAALEKTSSKKRSAVAAFPFSQSKRVRETDNEVASEEEEEEILFLDEFKEYEDGNSDIPYDSCPPVGRKV